MTIQRLYEEAIKPLPLGDRLRLATLILSDIPPEAVVDYRDAWSDEDLEDFRRATWEHIDIHLEDVEGA
ncbi:MAG: hypothetical protein ACREOH_14365 [Candidatus Entotheonellia bacterium]